MINRSLPFSKIELNEFVSEINDLEEIINQEMSKKSILEDISRLTDKEVIAAAFCFGIDIAMNAWLIKYPTLEFHLAAAYLILAGVIGIVGIEIIFNQVGGRQPLTSLSDSSFNSANDFLTKKHRREQLKDISINSSIETFQNGIVDLRRAAQKELENLEELTNKMKKLNLFRPQNDATSIPTEARRNVASCT